MGSKSDKTSHELEREWNIFFDPKENSIASKQKWTAKQIRIFTFNTAEEYWRIMNNSRPVGTLPDFTDFYCFVADYSKPEWEAVQGGEWRFVMDRHPKDVKHQELATGIFNQVALSCIGEYFTHADLICGFVVAYRRVAKYALWTKYMTEEQAITTGKELRELIHQPRPKKGLEYFYHDEILSNGKSSCRFSLSW